MSLGSAAEVMPANDTGEASALGGANHIHELLVRKDVDQNPVTGLGVGVGRCVSLRHGVVQSHLFEDAYRRDIRLGEVPGHRFVDLGRLDEVDVADLGGVIAVLRERLELRNDAWPRLEHGHRMHVAAVVKQLRHADFLAENS